MRAAARLWAATDFRNGNLFPALLAQQAMMVTVAKYKRSEKNVPLRPTHHRIPHRRRITGPLNAVPGARWLLVPRADAVSF